MPASRRAAGNCRRGNRPATSHAIQVLALDAFIDPGAAALAAACEQVGVKAADERAVLVLHRVVTNIVVPGGDILLALSFTP